MPDLLNGEVDLDAPAPPAPDPAPVAAEPAVDVVEEEAPPLEAGADPAAPPAPKKRGLVEELVEERRERKELTKRLDALQNDPVLARLTPDMRQAIAEGRMIMAPPANSREGETARLTTVAERYGLVKADGTPDLETAKRVDAGIRETVREEIAPLQNMTLGQKAAHYTNIAVDHALKTLGPDQAAIVREEYETILRQPNGAKVLSQPEVAKTIWRQAMGRLVEEGKYVTPKPAAPGAGEPGAVPPPVPAPGTGRRAPTQGVTLSPAVQKVYRDNGLDPSKAASAVKMPVADAQGYISLGD